MLKMRECGLKLTENHPVKIWLKWIASPKPYTADQQKQMAFMSEIINSKFNLITDIAVKNKIIKVLTSIPGKTLGEEILRSYLYLMIGNITRSDNIIRSIINQPPFKNWQGFSNTASIYHQISKNNMPQILSKLARHPSDRKSYELLSHYLEEFFNDPVLIEQLTSHEKVNLDGKWSLRAVTRIAPDLTDYVRLSRMEENRRLSRLKKGGYRDAFLSSWVWYFFNVNQLVSETYLPELERLEANDYLWFLYLMENEKLSDLYITKKGKNYLPGSRSRLKASLLEKPLYMLALYKLIQLGDIDQQLVKQTIDFSLNE